MAAIDQIDALDESLSNPIKLADVFEAVRKERLATIAEVRRELSELTSPSSHMPGASLMVYWDTIESVLDTLEEEACDE